LKHTYQSLLFWPPLQSYVPALNLPRTCSNHTCAPSSYVSAHDSPRNPFNHTYTPLTPLQLYTSFALDHIYSGLKTPSNHTCSFWNSSLAVCVCTPLSLYVYVLLSRCMCMYVCSFWNSSQIAHVCPLKCAYCALKSRTPLETHVWAIKPPFNYTYALLMFLY